MQPILKCMGFQGTRRAPTGVWRGADLSESNTPQSYNNEDSPAPSLTREFLRECPERNLQWFLDGNCRPAQSLLNSKTSKSSDSSPGLSKSNLCHQDYSQVETVPVTIGWGTNTCRVLGPVMHTRMLDTQETQAGGLNNQPELHSKPAFNHLKCSAQHIITCNETEWVTDSPNRDGFPNCYLRESEIQKTCIS